MAITVQKSIDVEDAIRAALDPYLTTYCRPLPENFKLPCILVQGAGGDSDSTANGIGKVDNFTVVIDARAKGEAEALNYLRNAIAVLERGKAEGVSYIAVNSHGSWGVDPVRPDLAMCSATLVVKAHRETVTLND